MDNSDADHPRETNYESFVYERPWRSKVCWETSGRFVWAKYGILSFEETTCWSQGRT